MQTESLRAALDAKASEETASPRAPSAGKRQSLLHRALHHLLPKANLKAAENFIVAREEPPGEDDEAPTGRAGGPIHITR